MASYYKHFLPIFVLILFTAVQATAQVGGVNLLSQLNPSAGPGFYQDVWGYVAPDGREYALLGSGGGTNFIDITDPSNPVEAGFIAGPTLGWYDIKVYQNYAYITNEGTGPLEGLQIVDLSGLPGSVTLVNTYKGDPGHEFTHCHNIYIDTTRARAYICGGDVTGVGGMQMLDLSDPVNPTHIATYNTRYVHDMSVRNDTLFSCELGAGLTFMDVSGSSFNTLANHTYPNNFTHNAWASQDGKYVLTTDEIVNGMVKIWDIQDINNVNLVSEYTANPQAIIHNVHVRGDSAYISHYSEGLRVLDITDPADPLEVGAYDTFFGGSGGFNGAWGVFPYLDSRNIVIGNMEDGLWVLEMDGGILEGTVTDQSSGLPIEGVTITLLETGDEFTTDPNGEYWISLSEGNYTLTFEKFAYDSTGLGFTVTRGLTTDGSIALTVTPTGDLSGTVTDGSNGIENVYIGLKDTPLSTSSTSGGSYSINGVPIDDYTIAASKFGYLNDVVNTTVTTGTNQLDFTLVPGFADDFEYDQGWTAGAPDDDATEGLWVWVDPNGVSNGNIQPEDDHTPDGTLCFITGQSPPGAGSDESNDVDGGKTTLLTPVFDLTAMGNPQLNYFRYYYRQSSEDYFACDISNDGGATWVNLETLTARKNSWNEVNFVLTDYITITSTMQIRFVAEDVGSDTRVEAAVDDFSITDFVLSIDDPGAAPRQYALFQNYPNPFNPATTIRYDLAQAGPVKLTVYNMLGKEIATLVNGVQEAGTNRVTWNGRDSRDRPVASGVYFYKLVSGDFTKTMKLILVK